MPHGNVLFLEQVCFCSVIVHLSNNYSFVLYKRKQFLLLLFLLLVLGGGGGGGGEEERECQR